MTLDELRVSVDRRRKVEASLAEFERLNPKPVVKPVVQPQGEPLRKPAGKPLRQSDVFAVEEDEFDGGDGQDPVLGEAITFLGECLVIFEQIIDGDGKITKSFKRGLVKQADEIHEFVKAVETGETDEQLSVLDDLADDRTVRWLGE